MVNSEREPFRHQRKQPTNRFHKSTVVTKVTDSRTLLLPCFVENRRLGQGQEHDFLAGDGANVVMQGQHLGAGTGQAAEDADESGDQAKDKVTANRQ